MQYQISIRGYQNEIYIFFVYVCVCGANVKRRLNI